MAAQLLYFVSDGETSGYECYAWLRLGDNIVSVQCPSSDCKDRSESDLRIGPPPKCSFDEVYEISTCGNMSECTNECQHCGYNPGVMERQRILYDVCCEVIRDVEANEDTPSSPVLAIVDSTDETSEKEENSDEECRTDEEEQGKRHRESSTSITRKKRRVAKDPDEVNGIDSSGGSKRDNTISSLEVAKVWGRDFDISKIMGVRSGASVQEIRNAEKLLRDFKVLRCLLCNTSFGAIKSTGRTHMKSGFHVKRLRNGKPIASNAVTSYFHPAVSNDNSSNLIFLVEATLLGCGLSYKAQHELFGRESSMISALASLQTATGGKGLPTDKTIANSVGENIEKFLEKKMVSRIFSDAVKYNVPLMVIVDESMADLHNQRCVIAIMIASSLSQKPVLIDLVEVEKSPTAEVIVGEIQKSVTKPGRLTQDQSRKLVTHFAGDNAATIIKAATDLEVLFCGDLAHSLDLVFKKVCMMLGIKDILLLLRSVLIRHKSMAAKKLIEDFGISYSAFTFAITRWASLQSFYEWIMLKPNYARVQALLQYLIDCYDPERKEAQDDTVFHFYSSESSHVHPGFADIEKETENGNEEMDIDSSSKKFKKRLHLAFSTLRCPEVHAAFRLAHVFCSPIATAIVKAQSNDYNMDLLGAINDVYARLKALHQVFSTNMRDEEDREDETDKSDDEESTEAVQSLVEQALEPIDDAVGTENRGRLAITPDKLYDIENNVPKPRSTTPVYDPNYTKNRKEVRVKMVEDAKRRVIAEGRKALCEAITKYDTRVNPIWRKQELFAIFCFKITVSCQVFKEILNEKDIFLECKYLPVASKKEMEVHRDFKLVQEYETFCKYNKQAESKYFCTDIDKETPAKYWIRMRDDGHFSVLPHFALYWLTAFFGTADVERVFSHQQMVLSNRRRKCLDKNYRSNLLARIYYPLLLQEINSIMSQEKDKKDKSVVVE